MVLPSLSRLWRPHALYYILEKSSPAWRSLVVAGMNDLANASLLFLIFAAVLIVYGAAIAKTGNVELLPYRSRHSIGSSADVKRVGRIVVRVGLVIGAIALAAYVTATLVY